MLTQEKLREHLSYDAFSGVFTWLRPNTNSVRAGSKAGRLSTRGYVEIMVCGERHGAHRLAWLYMTGFWPADLIDHINGDGSDNRWTNLREATREQNASHVVNGSADRGVDFYWRSGRWRARIHSCGKSTFLGEFGSKDEALRAYLAAASDLHQEFAASCHGVDPNAPLAIAKQESA